MIGFIALALSKNFDDYILGGRSWGRLLRLYQPARRIAGGWLLMGHCWRCIFHRGSPESWIIRGLTLGAWINWKLRWPGACAVRLPNLTTRSRCGLACGRKFEDKSRVLRIISRWSFCCFHYLCASGIVAGARLFESTFGMSYETHCGQEF